MTARSTEVVERLCALPRDFRVGSSSAVALIQASGYLEAPEFLTRRAALEVLRNDPSLVDEWELWSGNQRTDQGWIFSREGSHYVIYHCSVVGGELTGTPYTRKGGRYSVDERLTFSDHIEACAEYVLREIGSIARWAKQP